MKINLKKILICLLMFCAIIGVGKFYITGNEYSNAIVQEKKGNIVFLDKPITLSSPFCFLSGRLFLPLEELTRAIGGKITQTEDSYHLTWEGLNYELMRQQSEMLAFPLYFDKDTAYISLYDFGQLLHLAVVFDSQNETVKFYKRQMPVAVEDSAIPHLGKAYLRLEDVTTQPNYDDKNLEKFRVLIDYLYSRGQSFYIAWIPLYINPQKNIENDVTRDFNLYNADFVYTLDYAVNHNGNIVLHGLSHQENDTISGVGYEFGKNTPYTLQEIDARMKRAKQMAAELDYDNSVFEFPHNDSTPQQLKIAEDNFNVIYQQSFYRSCMGKIDVVRRWKHDILYVPTPAGYVENFDDMPNVLNRIDNLPGDQITSMFVHPYLDFDKITCYTAQNGERMFSYDENAIFPQLVKKITDKKLVFSTIKK